MRTRQYDGFQDKLLLELTNKSKDQTSQDHQAQEQTHTERNNAIQKTLPFHWKEIFQPAVPGINGLESTRFLAKWLLIGGLIGITSGVGAIVLSLAINLATNLFLRDIVGNFPPEARGDGIAQFTPITHLWILPFVTILGGLLCYWRAHSWLHWLSVSPGARNKLWMGTIIHE